MICMNQRHSEALNMRISPSVRARLDALAERFDQTITSTSRLALMVGLEALEKFQGEGPQDSEESESGG